MAVLRVVSGELKEATSCCEPSRLLSAGLDPVERLTC